MSNTQPNVTIEVVNPMNTFNGVYYMQSLQSLLEGLGLDVEYWMAQPPQELKILGQSIKGKK
jgi:hypothetical protein